MKKSGGDPHGTHEGSNILTQLSSVSIFLWLFFIISYIFFNNVLEHLWLLNFLSNDMLIISYPKQKSGGGFRILRDEHEHFEKMHAAVCRAVEAGIIHGDNLNESYVRVREYKLGLE